MASKKTIKTAVKKESGKKTGKSSRKSEKASKSESSAKKARRVIKEEDSDDIVLGQDDPDNNLSFEEALLDDGMAAEEREASRLDLE